MEKAAILGGKPICDDYASFMRWPTGGQLEKEAVLRVLNSGVWGTLGKENATFAEQYAAYCGVKHALPVINGTTALELILRGLGIGYGDEVIVPPYTFSASVHAIVLTGAKPVFADIDADTFCLCAAAAENAITPRTKAIMGVHLGGRPFDVDALKAVCDKHGLFLVEDAAHAHGSEWRGQRCGSLGKAAEFSFQQSKNIGCGEGGAITTNDDELYEYLWSVHHNGRPRVSNGINYAYLATNARLAEWQCAILQARMARIDHDIETRTRAAKRLDEKLAKLPFISLLKHDDRITRNSLHLYCFRYNAEALDGLSRDTFVKAVAAEHTAIIAQGYCQPIYEMGILYSDEFKHFTGTTFENPKANLPNNERIAYQEGCWIYHSSLLGSDEDTDKIVEAFEKVAANAGEIKKSQEA